MKAHLNPALARINEQAQLGSDKSKPTWILLCDSGSYKLFVNHGRDDGLHEISSDEQAIAPTTDIVSNDRGRNKARKGAEAHHAYTPQTDPREKEKSDFIANVAEKINDRVADFTRLIVAAPPSALHVLRNALSPMVKAKIVGELTKDLMRENASTLPHFIKEFIELKNSEDYTQNGPGQFGAS